MSAGKEFLKKEKLYDELKKISDKIGTELLISDIVDYFTITEIENVIRFIKDENKIDL